MKACKIINLTPHAITLSDADGVWTTYPSEGLARVASKPGVFSNYDSQQLGFPVYMTTTFGEVIGLPFEDREHSVYYVVSAMVGQALRASGVVRTDVLLPGTGPNDGAIRNPAGQVEAITRLLCY